MPSDELGALWYPLPNYVGNLQIRGVQQPRICGFVNLGPRIARGQRAEMPIREPGTHDTCPLCFQNPSHPL